MSEASRFLARHGELADAMRASSAFETVKRDAALDIDEERLYIVRGDTLGSEEDLFLETLVRGAQRDDPDDPARQVYLELDDDQRALVDERIGRGVGQRAHGGPAAGGTQGGLA